MLQEFTGLYRSRAVLPWAAPQPQGVLKSKLFSHADGLPIVRLHDDPLERLEVGLLAKQMHPPDRSVSSGHANRPNQQRR